MSITNIMTEGFQRQQIIVKSITKRDNHCILTAEIDSAVRKEYRMTAENGELIKK
jgi:hypothetical protein